VFGTDDGAARIRTWRCADCKRPADRNCDGRDPAAFYQEIGGESYRRCPLATLNGPEAARLSDAEQRDRQAFTSLWQAWRRLAAYHHLPRAGAFDEQPARFVTACDLLVGYISLNG
jgi:hypothetical protein